MWNAKCLSFLIIAIAVLSLLPIIVLHYVLISKSILAHKLEMKNKFPGKQSPYSLLRRNEHRWKRLEDYYGRFLNLSSFHQPVSSKSIIYSCHSICFGWGDRLRGITSVYILALLTRRRFMIDMDHPCSISHVLQPNIIDWRFRKLPHFRRKNRTKLVINTMPLRPKHIRENMTRMIQSEDFLSRWSHYDDIEMTTNGVYIADVFRNPHVNASWLLGSLPLKQATQESLFPLLFELLFTPKPVIYHAVERILRRPHQQLTCLHIRLGKNPSNPHDVKFPHRINLTKIMLEFLAKNRFLIKSNKTLLFVASDSDQAIRQVHREYPKLSISVPGPILHIDNYDNRNISMRKTLCDGLVRVVVEFYIFGECQYSVFPRSGFSLWANRRRLNPGEQLFIYEDKLKIIKRGRP